MRGEETNAFGGEGLRGGDSGMELSLVGDCFCVVVGRHLGFGCVVELSTYE
jgi:hypothetical protein